MKNKNLLPAILVVCALLILGGAYLITQFSQAGFSTDMDCLSACENAGYPVGGCFWPMEEEERADANFGGCLVKQSRHCGNPGQCYCYCFSELR